MLSFLNFSVCIEIMPRIMLNFFAKNLQSSWQIYHFVALKWQIKQAILTQTVCQSSAQVLSFGNNNKKVMEIWFISPEISKGLPNVVLKHPALRLPQQWKRSQHLSYAASRNNVILFLQMHYIVKHLISRTFLKFR